VYLAVPFAARPRPNERVMASSPRIDDLRKKFEENPRRYFAPLANEYRKAGEIEEAISICREYLPQQPGHMSGHIVFGQALYEARLFDESKAVFETALTLDPENLIALRHLGDIALLVGDNEAARGWYKRVLDADPRNEEIQSQLALLDKPASEAPTAATTIEAPAVPDPSKTPLSSTVVEQPAVPRPGAAGSQAVVQQPAIERPSPAAATVVVAAVPRPGAPTPVVPTVEVPAAGASDLGLEPTSISSGPPPAAPAPAQQIVLESHNMAGSTNAPPIDSFSLDGLETTSLAAPASAPPPPATAPVAAAAPGPAAPLPDLDFGDVAAPPVPPASPAASAPAGNLDFSSQSTTAIPAAAPPVPTPAAAPEIDLDFSPPTAPPAAPTEPAPATVDLEFLTTEPASSASPPAPIAQPASAAVEAPAAPAPDLPMLDVDEPPPVPTSPAVPAPVAEAIVAEPFMTETMAELYLRQGHREKALEVYRAVLVQRPGDVALRARVATLEALAPPAPPVHHGPSIRDVLGSIASRRPGSRASTNGGAAAATPPASPSDAGDAFSALMLGGHPDSADEMAAIVLATAFASSNGDAAGGERASAEMSGQAARPAASELSLDTVFSGGSGASTTPASDFALNQYFSQRAHGEPGSAGETRDARHESPEEVAKFTQWLEGLKRR
jgi:hypothetical protein